MPQYMQAPCPTHLHLQADRCALDSESRASCAPSARLRGVLCSVAGQHPRSRQAWRAGGKPDTVHTTARTCLKVYFVLESSFCSGKFLLFWKVPSVLESS
eukprot:181840-Rhodomonas_salina.1